MGGAEASTGDGDGDPSTGDGDGDPSTGDGDPSTGDGDGHPSTGDGDPEPYCGDGVLDPGEECDDGNFYANDGCSKCMIVSPEIVACGNKVYACGDTLDNDLDGLIDLDDPECISPCDDDEGSFKTNLPGQNKDCKSDCYFDSNSGSGDDKCEWNLQCDPQSPGAAIGCEYDPDFAMCELEMPQACLDFCAPLVPNGCDCFGCCEIDGQFVYLDGADCSLADLDACVSCTFFEGCNNPCEPENCELCFGQDPNELPEGCTEPGCGVGQTSCFSESDCPDSQYCQTGCCVAIVPQ
jgi:cysteine-rich repeat protein